MKHRIIATIALCGLFALLSSSAADAARKKKTSTVDRVALARVLLRDGLVERAMAVLDGPADESESLDLAEYHRVRGLVAMELRQYPEAIRSLEIAMEKGEQTAPTFFALANAMLGAERYPEALAILREAPPELDDNPARYRLEGNIHYRSGNKHAAFEALDRGLGRFPDSVDLMRQRLGLLMELGLYAESVEAARPLLASETGAEKDYLALGAALLQARQHDRALALLEEACLRWPEASAVRKMLARAYAEAGRPRSAAQVLRPISSPDSELQLMTAELHRRAGQLREAIHVNAEVLDQAAKMRQRLSLLLELERFEEAALLENRLERLGLLSDQAMVYALAYAAHYAGHPDQAERLVARLDDPTWFEKGNAIRRAIETCRREPALCD